MKDGIPFSLRFIIDIHIHSIGNLLNVLVSWLWMLVSQSLGE